MWQGSWCQNAAPSGSATIMAELMLFKYFIPGSYGLGAMEYLSKHLHRGLSKEVNKVSSKSRGTCYEHHLNPAWDNKTWYDFATCNMATIGWSVILLGEAFKPQSAIHPTPVSIEVSPTATQCNPSATLCHTHTQYDDKQQVLLKAMSPRCDGAWCAATNNWTQKSVGGEEGTLIHRQILLDCSYLGPIRNKGGGKDHPYTELVPPPHPPRMPLLGQAAFAALALLCHCQVQSQWR